MKSGYIEKMSGNVGVMLNDEKSRGILEWIERIER